MAHNLTVWIAHYGSLAFFPLIYVNALGMPLIPAETLLVAGSVLAYEGKIAFAAFLLAAFFGAVSGSMTAYFIGRRGGQKLTAQLVRLLRIEPQKFAEFTAKIHHYGAYFLIIARFVPIARELSGLISGSLAMPFGRFMAGNIIGVFLWVLCWGALPYLFGHAV